MAVGRLTFSKAEREKLAAVLWLLNWISVVTGSLLLSLGLFLKVELQRWQEVMVEQGVFYVPHVLISTGLAACGINFLGGRICLDCTDTNKFLRWKLVLAPYVGCTFFFTSCILAGALMCYGVHSQLEESLLVGLRTAMRYYKDTDTPGRCSLKKTVDLLQLQFQCCGNSGYRDWTRIQWISSRYLNLSSSAVRDRLRSNVEGQYLVDGVPFSCCSTSSPRPCIQQQISNRSAHFNYDQRSQQLNLWSRGCRQVLLDHYTGLLRFTGLAVLLVWLFELLVLTGVRYLQTAMENVLLLGDPDSESDGWILENSLAETARSNFNVIKNLGKCYQADDDPNFNIPTASNEREVPSTEVQKSQVVPSPQVQEIQEAPSPKVKEVQKALSPQDEKIQDVASSQVEEVLEVSSPQVEEVQGVSSSQVAEVQDVPSPQDEEVQNVSSSQVEEVQDVLSPQDEEVQNVSSSQVQEVQDVPSSQVQVPETS